MKIAFQGEEGSFTEEAIIKQFSDNCEKIACKELSEVFKKVENNECDYAVIPIENSIEGTITESYDLLLESKLKICNEINLRIKHYLLANKKIALNKIKNIYSHTQAFGQCKKFLNRLNAKKIPVYNTAASVKLLKEKKLVDSAAICGIRAANLYNMEILAERIEDQDNNSTRFFVLSVNDSEITGQDKTSIIFSTKHESGALYQILRILYENNINLTKIESRPTKLKPWEYYFYLDFEDHRLKKNIINSLNKIKENTVFMKIIGSYPKSKD